MVTDETKWPVYIANAIEKNLIEIQSGLRDSTFVLYAEDYDADLSDASNIKDRSLNSAWNFADQFFFAYAHREPKMAGIEWNTAFELLENILFHLRNGEAITNPKILAFRHPNPKTG